MKDLKEIWMSIVVALFVGVICYPVGAFVHLTFDVVEWHTATRAVIGVVMFFGFAFTYADT